LRSIDDVEQAVLEKPLVLIASDRARRSVAASTPSLTMAAMACFSLTDVAEELKPRAVRIE
jgi:hypothetical protein